MKEKQFIFVGWMIDGSGGPIRDHVLLEIENGIITELRDGCNIENISADRVTDLSHCTILPPLVDSHLHLFMSGTLDPEIRARQLTEDCNELEPVIARHLNYLFSHGVLAVRDGGDSGGCALRYSKRIKASFPVQIKTTGRAWKQKNRYGSLIGRSPLEGESLAEGFIRETDEADWVKLVNSGLNSLKRFGHETASQFTVEEMTRLVKVAGLQGKKVMVHANGVLPVKEALQAGCHSIEHGFFMGRENIELMAEKNVVWVPTAYTMKAYGENSSAAGGSVDLKVVRKNLEHQLDQMKSARQAGVTIALGTDSGSLGVLHGESVVEEMKLLKKAGFSLPEIVQCATCNGARLLGIEEFGLLKKGKPATFLVSRGTPGQLPRKLTYLEDIYIDGNPSPMYRKNPVKTVLR